MNCQPIAIGSGEGQNLLPLNNDIVRAQTMGYFGGSQFVGTDSYRLTKVGWGEEIPAFAYQK